jgi:hypothetical protein
MKTPVEGRKSFTILLPLVNPLHHPHFKLRHILAKASIYFAASSKEHSLNLCCYKLKKNCALILPC